MLHHLFIYYLFILFLEEVLQLVLLFALLNSCQSQIDSKIMEELLLLFALFNFCFCLSHVDSNQVWLLLPVRLSFHSLTFLPVWPLLLVALFNFHFCQSHVDSNMMDGEEMVLTLRDSSVLKVRCTSSHLSFLAEEFLFIRSW